MTFPPIGEVDISFDSNCASKLEGGFHVKARGQMKRKRFNAELIRRSGAPMGWKIVKLQVGGG